MKTTEIIGKKVLDNNANEIGKVQEIDLELKSSSINKVIIVNSGELNIRKEKYEVNPTDILTVGDYIILNISKSDISLKKEDDIPDVEIINPKDIEEK